MATKWKGRTFGFIIALLLFTFGLTSIGLLLDRGHEYLFKTYFDTDQFADEMESFIHELGKYEIYHGEDVEDDWIKEKELSELYDLKKVFKFYLRDINTNEVYTNLYSSNESFIDSEFTKPDMKYIQEYSRLDGTELVVNNFQNEIDGDPKLLEGRIGVLVSAPEDISVIANYQQYPQQQMAFYYYIMGGMVTLFFGLLLMKKLSPYPSLTRLQRYYQKVPIDIGLFILIFLTMYESVIIGIISRLYLSEGFPIDSYLFNFIIAVILTFLVLIQMAFMYRRIMDVENLKVDMKKSILFRLYFALKEAFLLRSIGTQVLILFAALFSFIPISAIAGTEPELVIIYLLLTILIFIIVIKQAGSFNRILKYTSELAKGNLEPDLAIGGKSSIAKLAENINHLKHGVKTSKKEQAKSERLKTELITNVSHDLRTPLTSIITYTELLKSKELGEEEREAYIGIIDRKSKRLKVLIDDLFEASKIASGNIELVKKQVDMVQLLEQALGEYDEQMNQSSLQFRISTPKEPVYAHVDGQKIWRVLDNLIGNILKYALENTRVYISIESTNEHVMIIFKNVSKYELGKHTDELFERFKRGDQSRHTEGSGLGLAISKSIVDLHEGSMDIGVDGDLFKVIIELKRLF
ncbi:sensor histidine kinase [Heyndrickxia oleronia]|uniref:sensor histidine kinase n=1 Tax=Heyndrickxia oleronia TaxID=38875 RepID=UPI001B2DD169|nr:HAMP domain-containing sensor histidine kinase [Heyndrickxia oleronia]GIN40152.1 two-component sensor histidine kinase [Heyndrickxia oleronia]